MKTLTKSVRQSKLNSIKKRARNSDSNGESIKISLTLKSKLRIDCDKNGKQKMTYKITKRKESEDKKIINYKINTEDVDQKSLEISE
jgi:competence protein ComGF